VPEGVPADSLCNSGAPYRGLQDFGAKAVRPDGSLPEEQLAAEDPVRVGSEGADRTPCDQLFNGDLIERYRLLRDLRFARTDSAIDVRPEDIGRLPDEVDVFPLQPQYLADTKTGGGAEDSE